MSYYYKYGGYEAVWIRISYRKRVATFQLPSADTHTVSDYDSLGVIP
jgi:hypothetical protein